MGGIPHERSEMPVKKNNASPGSSQSISRRQFLVRASGTAAAGAFALQALPGGARTAFAAQSTAETSSGKVLGQAGEGVHTFKGIPYGASTTGKNRFMPPRKPESWSGVRETLAFGSPAPQTRWETSTDEDCLVLNVWTPGLDDGGKRPVMVWLHGGGFRSGSGASKWYDGTNLCNEHDVVVVTINHRLNVFGTNFLGDILGSDFALSGCAGMLDIVASLEWVRDNIANFGGDPDTVTIFGESGGGRKVSALLAMPDAKGLFHRAIIQSGAILRVVPREDGTRSAEMLLAELGIAAKDARKLQTVPVARLQEAYAAVLQDFELREPVVGMTTSTPVLDGIALPQHPFDPTAPSVSADVPVMVGYNRTEETLFRYLASTMVLDLDADGLRKRVAALLGEQASPEHVIDVYRNTYPGARPWDLYMLICTDYPRGIYPKELAVRKNALGAAPAFVYRFDWDLGNELKTPHALEIPFVFDNIRHGIGMFDVPQSAEAFALAKKMSASWVAFARTGNPNTSELPRWPRYTAGERQTMLFNNESKVENDPESETREVMEKVLGFV